MPIPSSKLVACLAASCELEEDTVNRFWRSLREAGLVPAGRSGRRGREAEVDSRHAATLLVAILASDTELGTGGARGALRVAETLARCRAMLGAKVFVPLFVDSTARLVEELILSPKGASLEEMISALINLERRPSDLKFASHFGAISYSQTGLKAWGRIEINEPDTSLETFPDGPIFPSACVFEDVSHGAGPYAENHRSWSNPGPLVRTTMITPSVLLDVAECLGPMSRREFEQQAYPKIEMAVYSIDGTRTPVDQ